MRNHSALIAMRRRGRRPAQVRLEVGHTSEDARHWPLLRPNEAHLTLAVDEDPRLLDLRFLVGCEVVVDGYWPEDEPLLERRLRQLFEVAVAARAGSVLVNRLFPNDEVLLWHA